MASWVKVCYFHHPGQFSVYAFAAQSLMFSSNVSRSYLRKRCQEQYNLFSYTEWLVSGLNTRVSSAWYHPTTQVPRPRHCYFSAPGAVLASTYLYNSVHSTVAAMRGSMFWTLRFLQKVPNFKQIIHINPLKKSRIARAVEDMKEIV